MGYSSSSYFSVQKIPLGKRLSMKLIFNDYWKASFSHIQKNPDAIIISQNPCGFPPVITFLHKVSCGGSAEEQVCRKKVGAAKVWLLINIDFFVQKSRKSDKKWLKWTIFLNAFSSQKEQCIIITIEMQLLLRQFEMRARDINWWRIVVPNTVYHRLHVQLLSKNKQTIRRVKLLLARPGAATINWQRAQRRVFLLQCATIIIE